MTPRIASWDELAFFQEEVDSDSNAFRYTSFGLLDDNETLYYGQLPVRMTEISLDQLMAALNPVPDDTIFPAWPRPETKLRDAPEPLPPDVFIKRASLELYEMLRQLGIEKQLCTSLTAEAQVLEELLKHPHPNLIGYHGCRIVRGHITGLVLDKHPHDLQTCMKNGSKSIDTVQFMGALESVIQHLHKLGWAHNDLTPANILVSESGTPVLSDFGGCQKFGTKLKYIRGTKEWIEGGIEDYTTSEAQHDIFALGKTRSWLDNPGLE
jgi:serine/threonine protein kinase